MRHNSPSSSSSGSDDADLDAEVEAILARSPSTWSAEEMALIASLDLQDPTEEDLLLAQQQQQHTCAAVVEPPPSSSAEVASLDGDARVADFLSSSSPTSTALLRERNAQRTSSSSCGPTFVSVLSRSDLIGGAEATAEAILRTHHVELVDCGLRDTSPVECFLNATHLLLQHNAIASVEGLELLTHLQVLVLHHNNIASLRPLANLAELRFLDVSNNVVASVVAEDLPCAALQYLSLAGNPCAPSPPREEASASPAWRAYRDGLTSACPQLEELDGIHLDGRGQRHAGRLERSMQQRRHGGEAATPSLTPRGEGAAADADEPRPRSSRLRAMVDRARVAASEAASDDDDDDEEDEEEDEPSSANAQDARMHREVDQKLMQQFRSALVATRRAMREEDEVIPTEAQDALGVERLIAEDMREREVDGTRRMRSRVYGDLNVAADAAGVQAQRALQEHWADFGKLVQTRHSIVAERRSRRREMMGTRSQDYEDALTLLLKEARAKDAETYRHAPARPTPQGRRVHSAEASTTMKPA